MRVVLTTAARSDLRSIELYVGQYNPASAEKLVDELLDRCERLADMPRAYPLIPRYEARGVRRRPFRNYLIFYRVTADAVEVVHILHGARDYERILFPDE